MDKQFEARWVSKPRAQELKRKYKLGEAVLLDVLRGFIIVEPVGSGLGDGPVLSGTEVKAELQPVWFLGHMPVLREARRKLGLDAGTVAPQAAR